MKRFKIQGQEVLEDGEIWETEIKKPIYGTCVALNKKLVYAAKANGKTLRIKVGDVVEDVLPYDWIQRSQRIEKVFRIPTCPMVLYQATVGKPQEAINPKPKEQPKLF